MPDNTHTQRHCRWYKQFKTCKYFRGNPLCRHLAVDADAGTGAGAESERNRSRE